MVEYGQKYLRVLPSVFACFTCTGVLYLVYTRQTSVSCACGPRGRTGHFCGHLHGPDLALWCSVNTYPPSTTCSRLRVAKPSSFLPTWAVGPGLWVRGVCRYPSSGHGTRGRAAPSPPARAGGPCTYRSSRPRGEGAKTHTTNGSKVRVRVLADLVRPLVGSAPANLEVMKLQVVGRPTALALQLLPQRTERRQHRASHYAAKD